MKKKCFEFDSKVKLNYSDVVIYNGFAYTCGQMSLDPETDECLHGTIEEETARALSNLERVLNRIGAAREDVISVTVYMKSDDDFAGFDKVYGEFFGKDFPVRTTITVKQLYDDLRIEISAIAAAPDGI